MKLINCSGTSIGFIFLAFIVISLGQPVRADYMVFETAPLGPTGQTGGYALSDTRYMGARFYFQRGIEVTQIGGHMSRLSFGGNLFGAIVPLSGPFDLPAGNPFIAGEVVASTVFDPGYPSTDFRAPLSVTLSPGYYALIFGTNALGSIGGYGAMPYFGQTSYPDSSYIIWQPGSGWWNDGLNNTRFVIEGNVGDIVLYCDAEGSTYSEYQYIEGVQVGTINNIPTGNDHYADYTSLSTTMQPGYGYLITVTRGNPWDEEYDYCGVWVDWNQDGVFDIGERTTMDIYPTTFTGIITPPLDAVVGDTRMRVRILWNESILPCGGTLYGEVEDYTITIPGEDMGKIYGKKWHDLNDNGEMDVGEPALSGWTIFLDEDYDGEIDPNDIVTTTDIQGNYTFAGLEPNEYYYVSEEDQDGWINTYPGAGGIHYRIWVEENNDIELNFGNYQLHNCDISGYKFNDLNNNGVWDTGEGPLSGWEIYIDENESGQWDSGEPKTTTNTAGFYEFANLQPGYYNIMEVPKAGWFQTYPGLTSGRLWGLEGRRDEQSTIAEVNIVNMTIEDRFVTSYNSTIIGGGCLAVGPSTLFYCPIKMTGFLKADNLFYEIDSETGLIINQGVLEMPVNEVARSCTWHKGILYVESFELPLADPVVAYLNRYDAFTIELISRDPLIDGAGDGLAADPYKDVLMSDLFVKRTLYEIDPGTAEVVGTIGQNPAIGTSLAYTEGLLYKTFWARDDIHTLHREDGSLIASQKLGDYVGFDAFTGGIGVRGGHRVWIGKRDVEANFGNRLNSEGSLSGVKYEDLNGNGRRDANEPGIADWPIYIDLDGDMYQDTLEPATVTDSNGNWMIDELTYGRYFVREAQQKGNKTTEPALGWVDHRDVNQPRDIVFDDLRNLLYISTEAGTVERFDLSAIQFLSPITVGGSPHGMDITTDYGALYVADTQLSDGNGVVHKVNLDTLSVTNLTYTVGEYEEGSYDIAIGSQGLALFTGSSAGSILIPLYVLDTSTDIITTHPDIMGSTTIRNNLRLVRSYDRSKMWLVNNSSNGWIGVYDADSNTFTAEKEFNNYLNDSPVALSRDGSLAAVQLNDHCRIVDSDFNMVMGLDDCKMAAEFDSADNLFYQFHRNWKYLYALDTVVWELFDHISTGLTMQSYEQFTAGETAITADGRVLAITAPDRVVLYRKEYCTLALPGRTTGQLDFGNKTVLCGDFDGDRDVDFLDLRYLCEYWLCEDPDGYVNMKDLACLAGNWQIADNIIEYDEDFETGDFNNLPWQHGGDAPWTIDAGEYFEGSFSARSADQVYAQSILSVTVDCGEGDFYFMLKAGTKGTLIFYLDGELLMLWYGSDGRIDWSLIMIPITEGTHTFEWVYDAGGYGENNAWIDAIRFPHAND
jgi:hypothetical protein